MLHTILHVTLSYKYGVGGLTAVVNGLLPALQENNVNTFVITPHYDFFKYTDLELEQVASVTHSYKKTLHTSLVFCANSTIPPYTTTIPHYLVKPNVNSPVSKIFDIGDEQDLYKSFDYSEPQNRLEYFNGAVASLIRTHNPNIPIFDIVHTHTWHTALSVCLIKEFEQLTWVKTSNPHLQLNVVPKTISTVHMLSNEQGLLIGKRDIIDTLQSVGLSLDPKFLINHTNLNQMYLGLQYADQVVMVSKGFTNDAITGKGYGLDEIFKFLHETERLNGITNGNTITEWNATLPENLGQYALTITDVNSISLGKQQLKLFLSSKYPQLNPAPSTLWFLYVGRFGQEKGVDMLQYAYEEISKYNGNLIIMGRHTSNDPKSSTVELINNLKLNPNLIVIDTKQEQNLIGKYFRAASDFTIVPSHFEACGLVPMEAMANCSIPITSDVQGLPDTVVSLVNNINYGTGFIYHEDSTDGPLNLKQAIATAHNNYILWQQERKIDPLLARLHKESASFDWREAPVKNYLKLYEKTVKLPTTLTPHINRPFPIIKVLHVSLEYKDATVGGLGVVTTQLIDAQNKFKAGTKFEAKIITPYYSMLRTTQIAPIYITTVHHTYNNEQVESSIYLMNNDNKHFLVEPALKYNSLFNINTTHQIYSSDLTFIERFKYFNSAVAAFIATTDFFQPAIIQLHGWATALSSILLREVYKLNSVKIVYTVHINNKDRGTYSRAALDGIGLNFSKGPEFYTLKQIGVDYADYTIGVSPNILKECSTTDDLYPESLEIIQLTRSFFRAKLTKTSIGILNGIDYQKYSHLSKLIHNPLDLVSGKNKIKEQLADELPGTHSMWKINPKLPVILYIGRFSPEKGVECFKELISAIDNRAIFFAIGKGLTDDVFQLIIHDSRQKDNIFITFSAAEQEKYGAMMRAAADFTFVPSRYEACGLVAMEGFANGSLCITSGVGGLKDFIEPFCYSGNNSSGNGFFYKDQDQKSLLQTINMALTLWSNIPDHKKNIIHNRIMEEGKKFDWLAENGAVQQYWEVFKNILAFQEPKKPIKTSKYTY